MAHLIMIHPHVSQTSLSFSFQNHHVFTVNVFIRVFRASFTFSPGQVFSTKTDGMGPTKRLSCFWPLNYISGAYYVLQRFGLPDYMRNDPPSPRKSRPYYRGHTAFVISGIYRAVQSRNEFVLCICCC